MAAVYENANNEITGAALQSVLLQMVSSMGKSGMLCNGVADGSTTPPVNPDSNIFYIAPTGTYPNFGGLVVADGEWAIFIYNGSWQKQSIPVVTADAVPTTGSTNPVQSGGVADALEQKADIDGYYSTLTAGAAENLVGRGSVLAEYTRRTSGGSASIGSGAAAIEKIHGNTIVWNQQVLATSKTVTVAGGGGNTAALTDGYNLAAGHKYYIRATQTAVSTINRNTFYFVDANNTRQYESTASNYNTAAGTRSWYVTNTLSLPSQLRLWTDSPNTSITYDNIVCFDLTLMGLDTLTASEFEALFPLNYYAYNTGSLLSLTGTGIETNGFNQWDEEWESGYWDTSDGSAHSGANWVRSKNAINCFPSTVYCLHTPSNLGNRGAVLFYAANGTYLGYVSIPADVYSSTGYVFTTPAGCGLIKFYMGQYYQGSTMCINFSWSGYRNGEYEAYWDSTLALPITTVTSGGSAVFADGMKSAFAVYDELTSTKAVKRLAVLDLGTIPIWYYNSTYQVFYTTYGLLKSAQQNAVCTKYANPVNGSLGAMEDKSFTTRGALADHNIIIKDTSAGTDPVAFAAAMSGVYLCYELATPVEYTLDNEVNLNYRVDDFGTETLLPQNTATPTTAPIVYDVRYAMNAVDTLRNLPTNYISKDSLKNLLDAFVSAGVISAYTMTYNAGTEQYTFTITA